MRKLVIDKEWLEGRYGAGGTLREIAAEIGRSRQTVLNLMREYGIERRAGGGMKVSKVERQRELNAVKKENQANRDARHDEVAALLEFLYARNFTPAEISRSIGCTPATVYRWNGPPKMSKAERRKRRWRLPLSEQVEKLRKRVAEIQKVAA